MTALLPYPEGFPLRQVLPTSRFNLFRDGKRFEFSGSGRARCERKNTATRAKYISGRVEAARHFPFFSLLFFSFSFRSLLLLPPPPSSPPFPSVVLDLAFFSSYTGTRCSFNQSSSHCFSAFLAHPLPDERYIPRVVS